MPRVVVTGAPHAGKTTLLAALRDRGFSIVPEAALDVIGSLVRVHGAATARQWRTEHTADFQLLVTSRQIKLEREAELGSSGYVICDRGWPDGLAYAELDGLRTEPIIEHGAALAPYAAVFVLEIVEPFDGRAASGRVSDEARARETHRALLRAYTLLGYSPVVVPLGSLETRIDTVLRHLGALGSVNGSGATSHG